MIEKTRATLATRKDNKILANTCTWGLGTTDEQKFYEACHRIRVGARIKKWKYLTICYIKNCGRITRSRVLWWKTNAVIHYNYNLRSLDGSLSEILNSIERISSIIFTVRKFLPLTTSAVTFNLLIYYIFTHIENFLPFVKAELR